MNQSHKTGLLAKALQLIGQREKPAPPPERQPSTDTVQLGNFEWIDMQDPGNAEIAKLASAYNIHVVQAAQSLQRGHVTHLAVEESYIFLLLQLPYLAPGESRMATSQISIFLGKDYLVTIHESQAPVLRSLFKDYRTEKPAEIQTAGRLLFHLLENLLKESDRLIRNVSRQLDDIEEDVFDTRDSDAMTIGQLRQKIMRLRRTLSAGKSVLEDLENAIDDFTGEGLRRYYESNTNLSKKLWETVEEARETIEIYKDADFTTSSEKTNHILAALTLLFTLTIPITIVATVYGMNILLPGGVEAGSWTFLGEYTALKAILLSTTVVALTMYLYFKSRRWF